MTASFWVKGYWTESFEEATAKAAEAGWNGETEITSISRTATGDAADLATFATLGENGWQAADTYAAHFAAGGSW